ncbi:MAG: LLM class flavin-dependent oxidoreductase [Gammaproteobacteria bacterium]|nr:LLM class flavin-dependent oxidoreductase [Gammaproteobacteria bacterium]
MRFGYFCNQNNRHLAKPFRQVVEETRDIARVCDRAGWHSIWFTEHHFGHEGFEVCPNPVMMSTDIAAHTESIRLGQAANIITFWHPLRFAEDLAMLDHMSNGRVECAFGRGLYGREALNLNKLADTRNPEQNFKVFSESLEIIRRAWREPFFEFSGEMFCFPEPGFAWDHAMSPPSARFMDTASGELTRLALVPRTLQQPSPPLWQVIDSPRSIEFAAANGLQGMFWIPPTDAMRPRFELYRDKASEAGGRELALGEGLALVRDMFVTETMAEAERLAADGILEYLRWVCHWRGLGNHAHLGETLPPTPGKLDLLSYEWLAPRNLLFGTPDHVAEKIEEMREVLNLETLLVWSNFPGIGHEAVMRSIRLFNEEVMPRFDNAAVRPGGIEAA